MATRLLDDHIVWWTGPGPLGMTFSSYALRHAGTTVWIDAVDPRDNLDAVLALGEPEHLIITFGDHDRDVNSLAKRYGAQVWVPEGEAPAFPRPDHVYRDGDTLPGGLKALAMPGVGYGDSVLYGDIAGKQVAFFGDAVMHFQPKGLEKLIVPLFLRMGHGPFQTKRSYRGGNSAQAMKSLPKLLDLHLDAACFSHGAPVMENVQANLERSLKSW